MNEIVLARGDGGRNELPNYVAAVLGKADPAEFVRNRTVTGLTMDGTNCARVPAVGGHAKLIPADFPKKNCVLLEIKYGGTYFHLVWDKFVFDRLVRDGKGDAYRSDSLWIALISPRTGDALEMFTPDGKTAKAL